MTQTKDSYADAVATLWRLIERFPATFFMWEPRRRPLKVGIGKEIAAQLDGAMSPAELSSALRLYTGAPGHLANMRAGVARIDLAGQPAGEVSDEDARSAAARSVHTRLKAAQRREAKRKVRPVSVVSVQVKRLSFSDLKAAHLARKAVAQR